MVVDPEQVERFSCLEAVKYLGRGTNCGAILSRIVQGCCHSWENCGPLSGILEGSNVVT